MKKSLFIPSATALVTACLLACVTLPALGADVSSMLNLGVGQNDSGETVSLVDVKCVSTSSEPRIIFSKEGDRSWCSQDIPELCSRVKLSMAIKVCRHGFSTQMQEYKIKQQGLATTSAKISPVNEAATPSDENNNLNLGVDRLAADDIATEKQRIQIEREKLELRRQELELNKRRLELERQSATTQ